ncbi:MAG: hypothetical protein WD669_06035 [Pirellulales bacterium]
MDFTAWVESLKSLAQVLAGFGLVTVLLSWLKHSWEVRKWTKYKEIAENWADRVLESQFKHPNELSELEWKIECEEMLDDAGFDPVQMNLLMDLAVTVAKGISTDKLFR